MKQGHSLEHNGTDRLPKYDMLTAAKSEQALSGPTTQASRLMVATVDSETTRSSINSHVRNQLSVDSMTSAHSNKSGLSSRKFDVQGELEAQMKIHQTLQFRSQMLQLNYKKVGELSGLAPCDIEMRRRAKEPH
eukprot:622168-Hanusia_phi.AAC.1